jgi:hypothetical protein
MFHHHMLRGGETQQRRASVFEIVGAWLHVWVPPRDVEVPPVPWRKLALGTAAGIVLLGIALAIMVPRIDSGKQQRARADAAQEARFREQNRARIIHEQTPRHGVDVALKPAAGASAAQRQAARTQLVDHVRDAVWADARARSAKGELQSLSGPATCAAHPGTTLTGRFGVLDCFVVAQHIEKTSRTAKGSIGYPFRAVVDFRRYAYSFCKVEGIPGELVIPDPRLVVALPRACQDPNQQ